MGNRSQAAPSADPSGAAASLVRAALESASTPLTGAQLAQQTGMTAQVVRHHLRAMQQAGTAYVTPAPATSPGRRGRPARTWALRHEADPHALAQVARVLATLIDGKPPADLDEQLAGIGASLARQPGPGNDPLMSGLARFGFSPRLVRAPDGGACVELDSCPFFDPTEGVTDTRICHVHQQLAAGMAGRGRRIKELEINPSGVGCRVHLEANQRE
jgi:predicted ArsR family transcriptional regulator